MLDSWCVRCKPACGHSYLGPVCKWAPTSLLRLFKLKSTTTSNFADILSHLSENLLLHLFQKLGHHPPPRALYFSYYKLVIEMFVGSSPISKLDPRTKSFSWFYKIAIQFITCANCFFTCSLVLPIIKCLWWVTLIKKTASEACSCLNTTTTTSVNKRDHF